MGSPRIHHGIGTTGHMAQADEPEIAPPKATEPAKKGEITFYSKFKTYTFHLPVVGPIDPKNPPSEQKAKFDKNYLKTADPEVIKAVREASVYGVDFWEVPSGFKPGVVIQEPAGIEEMRRKSALYDEMVAAGRAAEA